jgi:polar amino acid transport system substrate-binding protein
MTITGERARVIDFSSPYFDAKQALITPRGSGLDTLDELSGKRVGVQKDTTGETYLSDFAPDDTQVVAFADAAGLQEALAAGELDAAMLDNTVSGQFVADNRRLKLAKEFDTGEQYGMAVKKDGNIPLLRRINSTLADLREDGTYDKIFKKYFG